MLTDLLLQERRSHIMDRMRIAEQRKEVLILTCKLFIFPKSINLYVCYTLTGRLLCD